MANTDLEKQGYSGLERLMFFMTPVLFTIVLLGALFVLLDSDTRNQMLRVGNTIPVLKEVLPEPKSANGGSNDEAMKSENMSRKIDDLQSQLTEKESELAQTVELKTSQEEEIKSLEAEIEQLGVVNAKKALEDEQYQAKIQELASMYGKITPSKAAPILQSMTLDEMTLILESMSPDDRVRVMEKMNPKVAADATMKLKDTVSVKDRQIAALQSQLKEAQPAAVKQPSASLDTDQLKATFTSMDAKSAGELLLKMANISPSKVLRILNAVDDKTRSSIIAEMSSINDNITAQLVSKMMNGK